MVSVPPGGEPVKSRRAPMMLQFASICSQSCTTPVHEAERHGASCWCQLKELSYSCRFNQAGGHWLVTPVPGETARCPDTRLPDPGSACWDDCSGRPFTSDGLSIGPETAVVRRPMRS